MKALVWLGRVGWLLVIGSMALSVIAAATGSMSETEMIDNSLWVVLAFGFGVGLVVGARSQSTATGSDAGRVAGTLIMALAVAFGTSFARWYFLVKIFDRL
jgi:hypothetical protein